MIRVISHHFSAMVPYAGLGETVWELVTPCDFGSRER